jgi:hypothetical protein
MKSVVVPTDPSGTNPAAKAGNWYSQQRVDRRAWQLRGVEASAQGSVRGAAGEQDPSEPLERLPNGCALERDVVNGVRVVQGGPPSSMIRFSIQSVPGHPSAP